MRKLVVLAVMVTLLSGTLAACGKKGSPVYKKPTQVEKTKSNG
jgi:predicted small lipoprotein YifL